MIFFKLIKKQLRLLIIFIIYYFKRYMMKNNLYHIKNSLSHDNMILDMLNTLANNSNDDYINNIGNINNIDNDVTNIICPYCNISFKNEIKLNLHINKCLTNAKFNKMSGSVTFNSVIDSNFKLCQPPLL